MEDFYQKYWIDDWYESKQQKEAFRTKGKKLLKLFYDETIRTKPAPKYIEQSFQMELGREKFRFVGKIDRADHSGGGLSIIDYKTGAAPATGKPGDLDQLRVYQWAAQDFLKEQVQSMCYWYLDGNQIREIQVADSKEIEALKETLLETIHKILHTIKYDLFAEEHDKTKRHACNFARSL